MLGRGYTRRIPPRKTLQNTRRNTPCIARALGSYEKKYFYEFLTEK